MKCDVISLANKKTGSIDLDDSVFGLEIRKDLLARAVNWQLAKRRSGNHKVKARSEITGSTIKPFNQKGGGRARQGDRKAPHMRSGGTAFGPLVRDHAHDLPKKVRRLALKTALSSKQAEGRLVVIDEAKTKTPKTADLSKQLAELGWGKALVIDGTEIDRNFALAAGNIIGLDILPTMGANVYDILNRETLVLTTDAVEKLVERLK
jgi:large subunit ribosomal protein L4